MKNSKDLMPELVNSKNFVNCEISSLHLDSREVKEGGVFFAIKGKNLNGIDFIEEAKSNGANLVISEELVQDNEKVRKTDHEKIMIVDSNTGEQDGKKILDRIMRGELGGHEFDNNELRVTLASLLPEYKPSDELKEPIVLRMKPDAMA